MKSCKVENCSNKGKIRLGFCEKHYWKFRKYGDPLFKKQLREKGKGTIDHDGYIRLGSNYKRTRVHRIIIEKAIGKKIPSGAITHHIDRNRTNNNNSNLVLCNSHSYHNFLHLRERALISCGNAHWRKCSFCQKYDDPSKMYNYPNQDIFKHRECISKYHSDRRIKQKGRRNEGQGAYSLQEQEGEDRARCNHSVESAIKASAYSMG